MPAPPTTPRTGAELLRRTLRRRRGALVGSGALLTVWQLAEAGVPVLIGLAIDRAVATGEVDRMVLWAAILTAHFVVLSLGYRFGARVFYRAVQQESHRLRTEVSSKVLDPRGARTGRLPGDVLSIATSDADLVAEVLQQVALTVAAVAGFALTAVVLATIDPLLAVVVLVGVPVVLVANQLLAKPLTTRSERRQAAVGDAVGLATDLVRGFRPLTGFGGQEAALTRYRARSAAAVESSVAAARWEGLLFGLTQGLSGLFLAAVALVAGTRAVDGDLSIGELIAVVGLAQFVAEPLRMLAYLVADLAQSRASADRIVQVLAAPPIVLAGELRPADPAVSLRLDDVAFESLAGVSLTARAGELVALLAEDPADAAALMLLLSGEAAPDGGRVLLGDSPLVDLDLAVRRAALLVADHHVDLFEGDLRGNVDPEGHLGSDRLQAVLAASATDDVVEHSAAGLDEPVAVGGTTLSGGQRQRVGLARAFAAAPPALVLHDPTTAVDAVTEARIAEGLRAMRGEQHLTVVLTSSPALLAAADRVIHLRAGRVVAGGIHRDLLAHADYRSVVLR